MVLHCGKGEKWRRERDSNPRYRFWQHTRFPVVLLQPARTSLRFTAGDRPLQPILFGWGHAGSTLQPRGLSTYPFSRKAHATLAHLIEIVKVGWRRWKNGRSRKSVAEEQGFEPWKRVNVYCFSRAAPSTTRPLFPIFPGGPEHRDPTAGGRRHTPHPLPDLVRAPL